MALGNTVINPNGLIITSLYSATLPVGMAKLSEHDSAGNAVLSVIMFSQLGRTASSIWVPSRKNLLNTLVATSSKK